MEGSKAFAKDFMARWNIPTAEYRNFDNYELAKSYLDSVAHKVVLKANGLYVHSGSSSSFFARLSHSQTISQEQRQFLAPEAGSLLDEDFFERTKLTLNIYSAGGKGVILPSSKEEAHAALGKIMLKKEFGAAGDELVIEEFLEGEELSFLSFSDGFTLRTLPPAQVRFFEGSFPLSYCSSSVETQEIRSTVQRPPESRKY